MEDDGQHDEEETSDDDMAEEDTDSPWLSVVMTKEEKHEARKEWSLSVIVKLVGKTIGYNHLVHWPKTLWRPQHDFSVIDLPNGSSLSNLPIEMTTK